MVWDKNGNWTWSKDENASWPADGISASLTTNFPRNNSAEMQISLKVSGFNLTGTAEIDYRGHINRERVSGVSYEFKGASGLDYGIKVSDKGLQFQLGKKVELLDIVDDKNLQSNLETILKRIDQQQPGVLGVSPDIISADIALNIRAVLPELHRRFDDTATLHKIFLQAYKIGALQNHWPHDPFGRCFPAQTQIQTSATTCAPISDLRVGDIVMAFDPRADNGRGALVPKRVKRLYRNTTTEWIRLRWFDGEERELITTPGHHFLDQFGQFPTIAEMVRNGRTTVVLASGALAEVTAERITYSAETAHMFERATPRGMVTGSDGSQDWRKALGHLND